MGENVFAVLRETREKFMSSFSERCEAVETLLRSATTDRATSLSQARQIVHRVGGIAGTVGFPTVSDRASELERFIDSTNAQQQGIDVTAALQLASALRTAFTTDLGQPPAWAT